ncbi:hypothetical protein DPEC_G00349980 [Dallia pectoralis]|uniref:Uncharacterized protein n=1 Tax=Dallia pectoralis TaxID=75939 RepID=A0ACC2F1T2_DALPE|nr:hypothetical protein DPEC_G00349980 [Dallia pectoralis]
MDSGAIVALADVRERAHFYRQFIGNFIMLAPPFTALSNIKMRSLPWNPSGGAAFNHLRELVPISLPNRVLVNTSLRGITVLETVGTAGLEVTMEECRHWLEGSQHPLMVLTEHRNLEFI